MVLTTAFFEDTDLQGLSMKVNDFFIKNPSINKSNIVKLDFSVVGILNEDATQDIVEHRAFLVYEDSG